MWFGDLVTMRWWDDLWLNESFATYISTLCQAEATEFTTAWTTFANTEKAWAYAQDQLPSTHPIAADIPDVAAVEVNFDGITYAKGASVLKQLVAYVGQDEFLAGVRRYFRKHEYGNTTLADLLTPLSESSGRDLSEWADQWLRTSQVNTLRPVFELTEDGRYASFAIDQTAVAEHPILRNHRLAVGLYSTGPDGLTRSSRIELDVAGARTEVADLVGHPAADLVLVNDDDLTYAKLRLDERLAGHPAHEHRDDPRPAGPGAVLVRGLGHDQGRRAARPRVGAAGPGRRRRRERDQRRPGAAEPGAARTALLRRAVLGARPAGPSWPTTRSRRLEAAAPGSDMQLQWSRTFAGAARSEEHAAVLRSLLDGIEEPRGSRRGRRRPVGLPLRAGRHRRGRGRGDRRRGGARRDRHRGPAGRHRAGAPADGGVEGGDLASGPSTTTSVPNAVHEAILLGFWHPAQRELTHGYVDRYFADIRPLWDRRPGEIAKNAVQYLFPPVVEPRTIEAADAWLADPDQPAPLRRLVSEGRDGIARVPARPRAGRRSRPDPGVNAGRGQADDRPVRSRPGLGGVGWADRRARPDGR